MTVVVVFQGFLKLIRGYAPQCGRSFEEKTFFYDKLKCE